MTTPRPISEAECRRRRATSALIDAICQTSPVHAAFRDAGREDDKLAWRLFELRAAGEDTESVSEELIACNERLVELLDLIDCQWGALFDRKAAVA